MNRPLTEAGWAAWRALVRTPVRAGPMGGVLGLDWTAALALAAAEGLATAEAADLLAAGEAGLLAALRARRAARESNAANTTNETER